MSGMPCDPIQGQGHEALIIRISFVVKVGFLRHLQSELANDYSFLN